MMNSEDQKPQQQTGSATGQASGLATWQVSVLTIFPELFPGPLSASLTGKALAEKRWGLEAVNLRDFTEDKHRSVDDTPAGGGPGMVMRADVIAKAIDHTRQGITDREALYLSPRGAPFTQQMAHDFAVSPGLILLCGRFEGVDERVLKARNVREVSIGDFVMTGGELAAMCLIDAVVRLRQDVIGDPDSLIEESFESGVLEYPQYTRPRDFEGHLIPDLLLQGDHEKIRAWRREQALALTRERRPDLLQSKNQNEREK